jgi:hypothetical protein
LLSLPHVNDAVAGPDDGSVGNYTRPCAATFVETGDDESVVQQYGVAHGL